MPTGKYPRRSISVTFWEKVNKDGRLPDPELGLSGPCWEWTRGTNGTGYGRCWVHGKIKQAHHVGYELLVGKVPEGLQLDHLCKNHACVNPSHLEPVTQMENLLRGDTLMTRNMAKTCCPAGHKYDALNIRGNRICTTCSRENYRKYFRKKSELSQAFV